MLPDQHLSSILLLGEYLPPDDLNPQPLIDYELGGVALNDPSQGLRVQIWTLTYNAGAVQLNAPNQSGPTTIFNEANIVKLSLAFDQNMRPFIAYMKQDGTAKYYWYDTAIPGNTVSVLPEAITLAAGLDDKRPLETGTSDIILAYTKNNSLYFRAQRDRYGVEYLLKNNLNAKLIKCGMTNKNRFQFKLIGV